MTYESDVESNINSLSGSLPTISASTYALLPQQIDFKYNFTSGDVTTTFVATPAFIFANLANASGVTGNITGSGIYYVGVDGTYFSTNGTRLIEFRLLVNGVEYQNIRHFANVIQTPTIVSAGTQTTTELEWIVTGVSSGTSFQIQCQKNVVTVFNLVARNQTFYIDGYSQANYLR